MINKQRNAESAERKQLRLDAGLMSSRLPGVASIVITMDYYKKIALESFMHRTVNYLPGNAAYFHMDCMKPDCAHGGFDLESTVYEMVRSRQAAGKGRLSCRGDDAAGHTRIDYTIAIEYTERPV